MNDLTTKKYKIIKGGTINVCGPVRLKVGEIWDVIVTDYCGAQFRKLNKRGGSTCILNGYTVARVAVSEGKAVELAPEDPEYIAHDELRHNTGAR